MSEKLCELNKNGGGGNAKSTTPVLWNTSDTWSNANQSYYFRQGNLVYCYVRSSKCVANADTTLLTLPIGYRPTTQIYMEALNALSWNTYPAGLSVDTNGNVVAHCQSSYITGIITFYTEDAFPV